MRRCIFRRTQNELIRLSVMGALFFEMVHDGFKRLQRQRDANRSVISEFLQYPVAPTLKFIYCAIDPIDNLEIVNRRGVIQIFSC